jgi:2-dehydro-3-deoxygluconokinase
MITKNRPAQKKLRIGKMLSAKKFVAFGELLLRLDAKGHERFVQAGEFRTCYTGGEANVAVSLSQWGVQTFAVSKVPAHEIGQACINYLHRYGINIEGVVRGGERLGVLYVESGALPRPSKVIYDRAHSSFRDVQRREINWNAVLRGKDWLHFTGTAPALGPNVLAVLRAGLSAAKRLGVKVSFDCNYRSTLWSVAEARRILPGLMNFVNVFMGTHHDACLLFDIDAEPAESARQMCRRFGFQHVAYTLRPALSRLAGLLHDGKHCQFSREYEMQIVDRIGGGDAFSAGVIYGLLAHWPAQRTVEFAAAASCLKHTIPGDFNLVSKQEIEQLMAEGGTGRIQR